MDRIPPPRNRGSDPAHVLEAVGDGSDPVSLSLKGVGAPGQLRARETPCLGRDGREELVALTASGRGRGDAGQISLYG